MATVTQQCCLWVWSLITPDFNKIVLPLSSYPPTKRKKSHISFGSEGLERKATWELFYSTECNGYLLLQLY